MKIEQILAVYDAMFGNYTLEEIENYLTDTIAAAKEQNELEIVVALLNELIGFCRDTTQKEKALRYCQELLELLDKLGLEGSVPYATSLLNVANAFRAFGLCQKALEFYEYVLNIYQKNFPENDFSYASLYNNWALVYQELEDFVQASAFLKKALEIVDLYEEAIIPQATTRTNLGTSLIRVGTEEAYREALIYLQEALEIFEADGGKDFHYGAALVAMGDAYAYAKDYGKACEYYKSGLFEIEKHTGRNENYEKVLEKYEYAAAKCPQDLVWRSNLERSKEFYETKGRPMITALFPEYASRIAVGLVGEGSDCFGFDDEISADHDYEVGFCMWLTEEDYHQIGKKLQAAYDSLIQSENRLKDRRGVFSINQFYNEHLETANDYETNCCINFENLKEHPLAAATNGEVFSDPLGVFSKVRKNLLGYYPEDLWRKKLAQCIHEFSQYAQSNYSRMMARKDSLTSFLCVGKAVESVLDLLYLLEKRYAPYYKWKKKGLENSSLAKRIFPLLEKIAELPSQKNVWEGYRYSSASIHTEDAKLSLFEEIAKELLIEMKRQNLADGEQLFLEYYLKQILEGKNMDYIEKIILKEWQQFDKVKNEGGRADCQDDYGTFSLMRKSQYLTWNRELLVSFYEDLCNAEEAGWNLIMEKYARMMKSTNPDKYEELKNNLPELSVERLTIQEEIIKIQVAWMEEFSKDYPKMSSNARSIHTEEDSAWNTSYETYLRGELSTYSEKTFLLYTNFIIQLMKKGRNLAFETMENTAKLYGYESIDSAESKL